MFEEISEALLAETRRNPGKLSSHYVKQVSSDLNESDGTVSVVLQQMDKMRQIHRHAVPLSGGRTAKQCFINRAACYHCNTKAA